jgi:hypothetical protein
MKINCEFIGMTRKYNDWQSKREVELPDGADSTDLLEQFDIVPGVTAEFGFISVNNNHESGSVALKDGDLVKVYAKSFGG